MEHAQRGAAQGYNWTWSPVLILILMEHAQRVEKLQVSSKVISLNPYFNGTCSKSGGYCVVNNNPYQS